MPARVHLSIALALAAIVACAARPDSAGVKRSYDAANFSPTKGGSKPVNVNAVQSLSESPVHFPDSPRPGQPQTEVQSNPEVIRPQSAPVPAGQDAVAPSAEEEQIPALFRDETTPVNRRYPHAVLFGGTCGGSIIHPKWILTAAHCTLFTGGRYVLAGTNHTDDGSGVTKKVKKLYVHPLFSVGPYWLNAHNFGIKQVAARWDFMLAELEEPLELDGETIAAAPLDDGPSPSPLTYVGYAGYGTDHHGGYMGSVMHAMNLRVRPDEECAALKQYDNEDMLCAQGYSPYYDSACNGDSGSGLVDSDKLVGVASWVQNDAFECKKGNLVVFSKVASIRKWIQEVTGL